MRAATLIVGSIAVSSCLIALAFLLSDQDETSDQRTPAATVTHASHPTRQEATSDGLVQCDSSITAEGVPCSIGTILRSEYLKGARATIVVTTETGESLRFKCVSAAPTTCRDEDGATVYLAPGD